ncbi:MAG: hypothetical protein LQ340_004435 [Diploschistes diacapsis]|nr:MAG: hypothetical protein LQ340_004435 [Diploschistes diacapsis]
MNPHIATPRQHGASNFGGTSSGSGGRQDGLRMPRFFKRLFKFPQMDFEMAIWEMWSLLIAPKKVFRSVYYHKQTKNTWHRPDPSFTYLLSFFMALTGLAWGVAYAHSAAGTLRLTLIYVFVHFLAVSLLVATTAYFFVGRLLGPGIAGLPGRRRQQGLFISPQDRDSLEFGYCFDVSWMPAFVGA